jgi:DNA replication and repair protein RecF
MIVRSLKVCGFRNLKDAVFTPCSNINILFGSNAQGKTNIIEALWLFTGSKSFRGSKDVELITIGKQKGVIELEFESSVRTQFIKIELDGSRHALLNENKLESPSKLAGEFCSVIFSPEHLGLVKEGPSLRRKFLDAAICQIKPRHASAVIEYNKSLAQRNALLKDIPYHSELCETLDIWDEKLCKIGATIIFTRLRYLKKLQQKAIDFYRGIAKSGEELTFNYISGEQSGYNCLLENQRVACESLAQELFLDMSRLRNEDIARGYTHTGPHRDDLLIYINSLLAKTYGSQGQQRSVVLSLKLAEAAMLREVINESPVLLLDDVLSELDHDRQDYLLNNISGMQVFITCCDKAMHEKLVGGKIFKVENGSIEEI